MQISNRMGLAILIVAIMVSSALLYPLLQNGVTIGGRNYYLPGTAGREPQLSAYDDGWNDLSQFREALEEDYNVTAILSNPAVLNDVEDVNRTLVIVAGAEAPYSSIETEVLAGFMEAGGRMLVMGDFDSSDTVARLFTVRFADYRLWDENYERNVSLVNVDAVIGTQNYTLQLNAPTALETRQAITAEVWSSGVEMTERSFARTSKLSWLDSDDNGVITPADKVGPHTVAAECRLMIKGIPRGRAVFISDASIAVNGMWEVKDNAAFLEALVASLLPTGGTVIFDESRHTQNTFGASLFKAGIGFYFLLAGDTLLLQFFRLMVVILGSYIILAVALRQPNPQRWQHTFDIHRSRPLRNAASDPILALQRVLLERMRLKYSLYEFNDMPFAQRLTAAHGVVKRYNILLDGELSALLFKPDRINRQNVRRLAQKVQKWSL